MRCHVHGKLEHAGVNVDFTISLDALTRESAELYVLDLFQGPYAVPVIDDVEITEVDCESLDTKEVGNYLSVRAPLAPRATRRRRNTRAHLSEHPRRHEKPFRAKYLRDAW